MSLSQLQKYSYFDNVSSVILCNLFSSLSKMCCAFCEKTLLSIGAAIDMSDNDGWTALMFSTQNGHFQVAEVRILI